MAVLLTGPPMGRQGCSENRTKINGFLFWSADGVIKVSLHKAGPCIKLSPSSV